MNDSIEDRIRNELQSSLRFELINSLNSTAAKIVQCLYEKDFDVNDYDYVLLEKGFNEFKLAVNDSAPHMHNIYKTIFDAEIDSLKEFNYSPEQQLLVNQVLTKIYELRDYALSSD